MQYSIICLTVSPTLLFGIIRAIWILWESQQRFSVIRRILEVLGVVYLFDHARTPGRGKLRLGIEMESMEVGTHCELCEMHAVSDSTSPVKPSQLHRLISGHTPPPSDTEHGLQNHHEPASENYTNSLPHTTRYSIIYCKGGSVPQRTQYVRVWSTSTVTPPYGHLTLFLLSSPIEPSSMRTMGTSSLLPVWSIVLRPGVAKTTLREMVAPIWDGCGLRSTVRP